MIGGVGGIIHPPAFLFPEGEGGREDGREEGFVFLSRNGSPKRGSTSGESCISSSSFPSSSFPSSSSSSTIEFYGHLPSPAPLCSDTLSHPLFHFLLSPCCCSSSSSFRHTPSQGGREGGRGGGVASFLAGLGPREKALLQADHLAYGMSLRRVCG